MKEDQKSLLACLAFKFAKDVADLRAKDILEESLHQLIKHLTTHERNVLLDLLLKESEIKTENNTLY